ncbi:hypothetical protein GHT06_021572 [Daphnia sinensis]|uniref:Uncharacterized protein n=1 Tax=Daphnia sinensis TaxID=1820382 RepID=A0AAD5KJ99_9CRUS|nr:hypothetical protein GHT06_021572 [Daphnia sinensis]
MTVHLTDTKKGKKFLKQVRETISRGPNMLPAKELARTLEKIVATEPPLGPVVIMVARAVYSRLDEAVCDRGWHTQFTMDKESIDGLTFFAENCPSFENAPIRSAATEISVLSIIGPSDDFIKRVFVANHTRTDNEKIWASDEWEFFCNILDSKIRLGTDRSTYLVGMESERQPPKRLSCLSVAPFAAADVAPPLFQNFSRRVRSSVANLVLPISGFILLFGFIWFI